MDPNAALSDILKCARRICEIPTDHPEPADRAEALALAGDDLANMILDLNNWLEQGGFPPDSWRASFLDGLITSVNSIAADVETLLERS